MAYRVRVRYRAASAWVLFALLAGGAAACGNGVATRHSLLDCSLEARAGLLITLRDSTGYPIGHATIQVTDGEYSEELTSPYAGAYWGAFERPGSYLVRIVADGYSDTEIGPIEVDADECHVRTQRRNLEFFP